jgi:glutamine amidotransferase
MIAIIDYGMGNIHSVNKALELCGAKTLIANKPSQIKACDKVVLPGVGAFADAVSELKKQDLIPALYEHIKKGKVFLGICLGMQLLFEASQEASNTKGLGILRGGVKKFNLKKGLKVPHIGWNQINIKYQKSKIKNSCPLLKNIKNNAYVYFCHSYYPAPTDKNIIAGTCKYGVEFTAVVWRDNVYGVQFHPEKSQETGLRILKNFVDL